MNTKNGIIFGKAKNPKSTFYQNVAEDLLDLDPKDLAAFLEKYKISVNLRAKEYKIDRELENIENDFN
mgnify:CR=1 FL=1|jgi:hypothetical protein